MVSFFQSIQDVDHKRCQINMVTESLKEQRCKIGHISQSQRHVRFTINLFVFVLFIHQQFHDCVHKHVQSQVFKFTSFESVN